MDFKKISIAALVVLFLLVGFVAWRKSSLFVNREEPMQSSQEATTTTRTLTTSTTEGWNTYRNEEYGFEFSYPFYQSPFKPGIAEDISDGIFSSGYYYSSGGRCLIIFEVNVVPFGKEKKDHFGCDDLSTKIIYGERFVYILIYNESDGAKKSLGSFKLIHPVDVSDWKTYRNEEYGFEVKYPPEWKDIRGLREKVFNIVYRPEEASCSHGIGCFYPGEFFMKVNDKPSILLPPEGTVLTRHLTVGGRTAAEYVLTSNADIRGGALVPNIEVFIDYSERDVIWATAKYSPEHKDYVLSIFNTILSTFKFSEPVSQIDTSNWRTYQNERMGFKVSFPKDWYNWHEGNPIFADGPIFISSMPAETSIHGFGIPPSPGMWVNIAKGVCNDPSVDFVRPYQHDKAPDILEKTVCVHNFQVTLSLYYDDLNKADHQKTLELIEKSFTAY